VVLLKYYVVIWHLLFFIHGMSNTATAMMMLPIVFQLPPLEETHGVQKLREFTTAILLGWHMDALLVATLVNLLIFLLSDF
jgi:di/tricarboxylate transporter